MLSSRFYALAASVILLGLIVSVLAVPTGYTQSTVCSKCGGEGSYTCSDCGGSGKCTVCGGTGSIWYMPPESSWCAFCSGSGVCSSCGGMGKENCETCGGSGNLNQWMFNLFGSAAVLSIVDMVVFLVLFTMGAFFADFYLSFNSWVHEVSDMGFWFNPSFMVWLFAKDRKRWAKWEAGFCVPGAIYFGAFLFFVLSYPGVTSEIFVGGLLLSIIATGGFAWLFYKYSATATPNVNEFSQSGV